MRTSVDEVSMFTGQVRNLRCAAHGEGLVLTGSQQANKNLTTLCMRLMLSYEKDTGNSERLR